LASCLQYLCKNILILKKYRIFGDLKKGNIHQNNFFLKKHSTNAEILPQKRIGPFKYVAPKT
jgi:hypothetical protein